MNNLLKEYTEIQAKLKAYKAREEELKVMLKAKIEACNGCYIEDEQQITVVNEQRKGSIDLDKLIASEINPDNFRKPTITVSKFKIMRTI